MADEQPEGKLFATFEDHGQFLHAQQEFLALDLSVEPSPEDNKTEQGQLLKMNNILNDYQEQAYLLDPFLENLVVPVVDTLKKHAKGCVLDPSSSSQSTRIGRLSSLLYSYIKFRGYKTIIRFFPHEIADLSIVLGYLALPAGPARDPSQWQLRYVVLLWMSLICMIPFDLAQFDEVDAPTSTAISIETLAKGYLGNAGLEREGAAILLSRLYMRKDAISRFHHFLTWAAEHLSTTSPEIFVSVGLLEVLCEVLKSGPVEEIRLKVTEILNLAQAVNGAENLQMNTLARKYKTKLLSRVALRLLSAKSHATKRRARALAEGAHSGFPIELSEDDIDVPEEVEGVLEELFSGLQDKDTVVRWSAAKGVARIAERLPAEFATQVLDTVMGLFEIHSVVAAGMYDLPAIAESTWHGACLACAELARRSLVPPESLPTLIDWLSKALYFDIRKGAHSIGSNVRDAAAYVLWALARAQGASSIAPHADNLARRLVAVTLFDREIHIRRAASAAFQEHVGRMSLFPHGIDVLRKTDFYAVSVRRNAFTVAAPQVAEHPVYCSFMMDHIIDITLRHWDPSMRKLGSQSLSLICESDLGVLGPQAAQRVARLLGSVDTSDLHGALLALSELASAYVLAGNLEKCQNETFSCLSKIPQSVVQGSRNEAVTAAACRLISNSITLDEIKRGKASTVPHWREIVDFSLKHRITVVQEAAVAAMASVSRLVDCSEDVTRLTRELRSSMPVVQQSLGPLLASLDYSAFPHGLPQAIQCLHDCVAAKSPSRLVNVEARRNCYNAIPQILTTVAPRLSEHLSPEVVQNLFNALLLGLKDYSTDERGDVGSWIRMAAVRGLTLFAETLLSQAGDIPNLAAYLPPPSYHAAIGGILRQGVERLDNVRQVAGECFLRLLKLSMSRIDGGESWTISGEILMKELFMSEKEPVSWSDGNSLFPRAVRMLAIEKYRKDILAGLVLSVGSKTNSTQRPVSASLPLYARSLPLNTHANDTYSISGLVGDLLTQARQNPTNNTVVIPILQTLNVLLEADALEGLSDDLDSFALLQTLLETASRNVARFKSIPRIHESMKIVMNLLTFECMYPACVPLLGNFLAHQFPRVRTDTAEYLYLVIQSKELGRDTDEIENLLLETEWSSMELSVCDAAVVRLIALLA